MCHAITEAHATEMVHQPAHQGKAAMKDYQALCDPHLAWLVWHFCCPARAPRAFVKADLPHPGRLAAQLDSRTG